ncbi:MAG: hypothetical protein RL277_934 [Planctomycetota bacterium]|jgi:glutamyl-tRNA reductase
MDAALTLTLVGISHRTAPIAVRERYVVQASDLADCVRILTQSEGIREAWLVSTCNRTEALVVSDRGTQAESKVRAHLFRNLGDEQLYAYEDVQALIHLFRVASGLDSLVVGESEILGQMKRCMEQAQAAGTLGPVLRPLLQQALHVGKRVRSETALGTGTLSVARVGIDMAGRVFGRFQNVRALIVGTGETGLLVARHLKESGIGELAFVNRTLERAVEAANELGGSAHPLGDLTRIATRADLVVSCVEAETPLVTPASFDRKLLSRRDRPMVVIDLSVPRSVAREVRELDNLLVYDMDDLQRVVEENLRLRGDAGDATSSILIAELHKFLALRTYASFTPAIAAMRERFQSVREEVLDNLTHGKAAPESIQIAHELTKRLLDAALDSMKEGARNARSEESLDREYRRFLENL